MSVVRLEDFFLNTKIKGLHEKRGAGCIVQESTDLHQTDPQHQEIKFTD